MSGVLVLSQIILGAKYKTCHWIGAIVCMAGLAILIVSDKSEESNSQSPRPILGDSLALLAACLYAITHVLQEKLLGKLQFLEKKLTHEGLDLKWEALSGRSR